MKVVIVQLPENLGAKSGPLPFHKLSWLCLIRLDKTCKMQAGRSQGDCPYKLCNIPQSAGKRGGIAPTKRNLQMFLPEFCLDLLLAGVASYSHCAIQ
ncbi:MAG: hypothetical protein LH628_10145 [Microcoleus sp. CAN_BIN18]|nr:hypothetical protein [Microcoleus sp. CAN_BIN18]